MNRKALTRIFFLCFMMTLVSFGVMIRFAREFRFNDECRTPFSIMALEFAGSKAKLQQMYDRMDAGVKESVRAHLFADYFFMAGCYPGIAVLCLLAAGTMRRFSAVFFVLAGLQVLPWLFDVTENIQLVCWMDNDTCNEEFMLFNIFVKAKFIIAMTASGVAFISLIRDAVK